MKKGGGVGGRASPRGAPPVCSVANGEERTKRTGRRGAAWRDDDTVAAPGWRTGPYPPA
ncbi:hypothetical protein Hdeb2414_s0005g00159421 [Helianthus debilis subsp. tardiflorus]